MNLSLSEEAVYLFEQEYYMKNAFSLDSSNISINDNPGLLLIKLNIAKQILKNLRR